ncbi:hypothetical protein [Taibaiella chishuiensis]|uniref:Uncharacterized protein n=1 Tax=Taibaiella chishuiensis TaxID=1434707 RepID=A0A2P8DAH7_9BACT|nr:hypothetical protein [Taibaiella chishuiensis]PSK94222.1 hypothetical protein B0I18_101377 [Taibaiella chishuiensis]
MKSVLTFLALTVAGFSANAALFINNNTNCEAVLVLKAHDANNPGSCAYYSTRFPVAGNTSMAFNNVTNVNSPGGPGWYPTVGGGTATLVTAGSGWDAVTVYYGNLGGAITFNIGGAGTCTPVGSFTGSFPGCSFTNATWTPLGGGNILLDLN